MQYQKTTILKQVLWMIALTIATLPALALNKPVRVANDNRIEVVNYSKLNVVPVNGSTMVATQIVFAKDEYILEIQGGDTAGWATSVNKNMPNMLFVKPTVYGSKTNMTVITNKHTYYFSLRSNEPNQSVLPTYAIHFAYPGAQEAKVLAEIRAAHEEKIRQSWENPFNHPGHYNWNYSYHGDKPIMPFQVFDDGKFTYMLFKPSQSIPAIFAVSNASGNESVVNYSREGNYVVIHEVAPQFTLRLGHHEVASIFNNNLIRRIEHSWVSGEHHG